MCVWGVYVYKNLSRQKRANLFCLRKQLEQTLMGRKPSKACEFQIEVYNWLNKILSEPEYTPSVVM